MKKTRLAMLALAQLQFPKYTGVPGYEIAQPYIVRRYCGLWGRGT